MKNVLSWLVLALISLFSFFTLIIQRDGDTVLEQEKRKITPFPQWPEKFRKKHVQPFCHDLEMFFSDRAIGRDWLLQLASYYPAQEDYSVSVKGKDGWLFLGNKFESYVDSVMGIIKPTKAEVRDKRDSIVAIRDTLAQRGIQFHMMVGPNKANVYSEYLPSTIVPARIRYIDPFLEALEEAGVDVYDPTPMLKAKKAENILYWRADSHWNQLGSLLATQAFLQHCGLPELPPYTYETMGVSASDLKIARGYNSKEQSRGGDNFSIKWKKKESQPLSDKKILVIGDSFSELPAGYLRKGYKWVRRAHYVRNVLTDKRKTSAENVAAYLDSLRVRPDVVLWIEVERFWFMFP